VGLKQKLFKKFLLTRANKISGFIMPYVNENDKILDFGCGNMLVSEILSKNKNIKITGIDVVDYNLGKLDFVKFNGGTLPFKDNEFDLVFSAFSLHHTDTPEFYLNELKRISKKKVIILEDTFANKFQKLLTYAFDWIGNHLESWEVDIPFNFLSIDKWKALIRNYSIQLEEVKRIYPYPIPFIPVYNVMMILNKC